MSASVSRPTPRIEDWGPRTKVRHVCNYIRDSTHTEDWGLRWDMSASVSRHIWKHTVEKSRTNATCVVSIRESTHTGKFWSILIQVSYPFEILIPWLVHIELVQLPFLLGGSQVNGLNECEVPRAGRDSWPALSGDHDTSVTKQSDATTGSWCTTTFVQISLFKGLCNSVCNGI